MHSCNNTLIHLYFVIVKTAIVETLGPDRCDVVFNLVPKQHAMSDIYCQLIHNENDADPYFQVMPRMGAFEVSVNGCVSTCRIQGNIFRLPSGKKYVIFILSVTNFLLKISFYTVDLLEMSFWFVASSFST